MNTIPWDKLEKALEKAGAAAKYAWGLGIRQAYIDGVFSLLLFVMLMSAVIGLVKWSRRIAKKEHGTYSDWEMGYAFIILGASIALFLSLLFLYYGMVNLLNPEWQIIQTLVGVVK
jgi:hypothetical protein